jgi:hypothetical protein
LVVYTGVTMTVASLGALGRLVGWEVNIRGEGLGLIVDCGVLGFFC